MNSKIQIKTIGYTTPQPLEWPKGEGPRFVEDVDKSEPSHSTDGSTERCTATLETARQF